MTEEIATTSTDITAQSAARTEIIEAKGISPSATEERATTPDTAAQSTSRAEVIEGRGTASKQRLGTEGNLDHST